MFELSGLGWAIASAVAVIVGISKTGVPGLGILAVPLFASILPAKASVGALLPMLIFADIFGVAYWRRHAEWKHLVWLLPWAVVGLVIGYFLMDVVSDKQLRPVIGVIVLTMLALNAWRTRRGESLHVPTQWWFAAAMGLVAGITTMMANAAGPVMALYLLAMRLPKNEFLGTGAWYFLIVNWAKVPPSAMLGLITWESLKFNAMLFPLTAIGAFVGIYFAKRIPQKMFDQLVLILAIIASVQLIVGDFLSFLWRH